MMAVSLTAGVDDNIILFERYISREVFREGSSINNGIKEYLLAASDPMKLSDIFHASYMHGSCTWRRLTLILILFHFRLLMSENIGALVYNLALIIYTGNCHNPMKIPRCTESMEGAEKVKNKYMLNYFKNACVHVSPTLETSTNSDFMEKINNLSQVDFIEIVECMYQDGYSSHKTIITLLMMYIMMMRRPDVNKWSLLTSFSSTLHIQVSQLLKNGPCELDED